MALERATIFELLLEVGHRGFQHVHVKSRREIQPFKKGILAWPPGIVEFCCCSRFPLMFY